MEGSRSGPRGGFCVTAQGYTLHLLLGDMEGTSIGGKMKCEQGPRAGPHDPNPGPLAGRFLYITIKSWALSGYPQRYTEPPLPSVELCSVPFIQYFFTWLRSAVCILGDVDYLHESEYI